MAQDKLWLAVSNIFITEIGEKEKRSRNVSFFIVRSYHSDLCAYDNDYTRKCWKVLGLTKKLVRFWKVGRTENFSAAILFNSLLLRCSSFVLNLIFFFFIYLILFRSFILGFSAFTILGPFACFSYIIRFIYSFYLFLFILFSTASYFIHLDCHSIILFFCIRLFWSCSQSLLSSVLSVFFSSLFAYFIIFFYSISFYSIVMLQWFISFFLFILPYGFFYFFYSL